MPETVSAAIDAAALRALPTRDRLVAVAGDLLQLRGYAGIGVAEILQRSGANKGSLYFHFPGGKEELVACALRVRAAAVSDLIATVIVDAPDAAAAVRSFASVLAARLDDSDFQRGCALASSTLDAGPEHTQVHDAVRQGYGRWVAQLAELIERDAVADDPEAEACMVLAALEGALLLARVRRDPLLVTSVAERVTRHWS
ncbi:TetR/AcrR family transcriptional regulator [Micromonospora sp. KC213]|uniref:TetR/AcrR family transcriptional regulator n=1 Tax=Micromonospora sp. KC213 TaxID=2530378 RepID=UPI001A9CC7DD|nr:TetR/AcrR family transcriptional regulator [Micromonospora sp. KC213]